MGEERRQFRVAAIIACTVHVMGALAVWRAGVGARPSGPPPERDAEISIELRVDALDEAHAQTDTQAHVQAQATATTGASHAGAIGAQGSSARASSDSAVASRDVPNGAVGLGVPDPSSSSAPADRALGAPDRASDDGWTFNPSRVDVMAGGTSRLSGSLADYEKGGNQNGGAHALADAVDSADAARGLGRGGAVLAVVEDTARTSLTPEEGSATFSVVVWKNGDVRASLVSASSGNEAWQRILGDIEQGVKKKAVPVPENASAVRFDVRVDSTIRWADGRRPAGAGTTPVVQGLQHEGLVMDRMQMIGVRHENKYCVAKFGITPAGLQALGACSPENGAQAASRQVRGQVTGVSRID